MERSENRKVLRSFERDLPCKLTDEEKLNRASRMAVCEDDVRMAQEGKKAASAEWVAKEKAAKSEMAKLAMALRKGTEPRPVAVEEIADFTRNCVMHVRTDTRDVLEEETRALRDAERQEMIFGSANEKPGKKAGKKKAAKLEAVEDRPDPDELDREENPFADESTQDLLS